MKSVGSSISSALTELKSPELFQTGGKSWVIYARASLPMIRL